MVRRYSPCVSFLAVCFFVCLTPHLLFSTVPPIIPRHTLVSHFSPISWFTGASYSTLMVYHRWVARITALHVILHSIGPYAIYMVLLNHMHTSLVSCLARGFLLDHNQLTTMRPFVVSSALPILLLAIYRHRSLDHRKWLVAAVPT